MTTFKSIENKKCNSLFTIGTPFILRPQSRSACQPYHSISHNANIFRIPSSHHRFLDILRILQILV